MALTKIFFVFVFLPASILLYRLIPQKCRNALLLLLSVMFIAWGNPADVLLISLSIVFNYFTALELDGLRRQDSRAAMRLVLFTGVAVNIAMLLFFKYFVFFMNNIGAIADISFHFTVPRAPIGISFFTFSAISCLCDVSKGDGDALKNPVDFIIFGRLIQE